MACLDEAVVRVKEAAVREFVPFDDCWYDEQPPGRLVPLPANFVCVRDHAGVFHWIPESETPENVITSPVRAPMRAAVPALSSST